MEKATNPLPLETSILSACFHLLSQSELELINTRKTQLFYDKGETLFKQGAFAPYILFIFDGLVKVFLQTGGKRHQIVSIAKSGDFLAFSAIYGEENYNFSATALRDSKVCMIDKDAMKKVLMLNPRFAMQITTRNLSTESRLIEIIKNLSYKQMRGKLASALCYLSSGDFEHERIFEHLTRQDIADFAGITLESAVKFLKEYERETLLELQGKDIIVKDRKKLQMISMTG